MRPPRQPRSIWGKFDLHRLVSFFFCFLCFDDSFLYLYFHVLRSQLNRRPPPQGGFPITVPHACTCLHMDYPWPVSLCCWGRARLLFLPSTNMEMTPHSLPPGEPQALYFPRNGSTFAYPKQESLQGKGRRYHGARRHLCRLDKDQLIQKHKGPCFWWT